VLVARDENCSLRLGEREEVVVVGVGGAARGRVVVGREPHCLAEKLDNRAGLVYCDPLANLPVRERPREFGQQRPRDDQLELASEPTRDNVCRRSASGEERGDEDVGVEDGAQSAAAGACLVLGLDGELEGLPLAQIVSLPQAIEQVETELAAQSLFDYLAIALPGPSSAHLDRAQNLLIDCERRPHLGHICIITIKMRR
jgi:hypothetical protein